MVGVGRMFPIHGTRARHVVLAFAFAVTAVLGALAATLFAQATSAPRDVAPTASGHVALYVEVQSWHAAALPTDRRLYLQTVLVNGSGGTDSAPAVQDFTVRSADGRVWSVSPAGPAFSPVALRSGEQRGVDMFVDLPASASQLRLVMQHGGQDESIPLVS